MSWQTDPLDWDTEFEQILAEIRWKARDPRSEFIKTTITSDETTVLRKLLLGIIASSTPDSFRYSATRYVRPHRGGDEGYPEWAEPVERTSNRA